MGGLLFPKSAWVAAAFVAAALTGCGRKEEPVPPPYVMPEVNEANCKFDAVKKMPEAVQQRFADMCARRGDLIHSEKKSYKF